MSLEAAFVLPLVALLLAALLQTVGVVRDSLSAQEAARAGARIAATDPDTGRAVAAARAAVGDRPTEVTVTPAARRPGDTATVTVVVTSRLGPLRPVVTGRATILVEPVVGTAP